MQTLKLEVLQASPLPSTLPAMTELGVWKRSTGYEVYLPYHRHPIYWALLLGILAALIIVSVWAFTSFPLGANTARLVFYIISSGLIITYAGFVFLKYYESRHTKTRIDLTAKTITFTRVMPSSQSRALGKLATAKIDEVIIDEGKGLRFNGKIADPLFNRWFGGGLQGSDLYYLALLVGQIAVAADKLQGKDDSLREL
jgi:hypothetical protein